MPYPPAPNTPAFISITPKTASIAFSETLQLTPALTDVNRGTVSASLSYTFSSSNPALLEVDSNGLCTAVTPDDPNALNQGGIVEITVSYPFANRSTGDRISSLATITVQAAAARTQAVLILQETQYGIYGAKGFEYRVVPESAPQGTYPPGWVVAPTSK